MAALPICLSRQQARALGGSFRRSLGCSGSFSLEIGKSRSDDRFFQVHARIRRSIRRVEAQAVYRGQRVRALSGFCLDVGQLQAVVDLAGELRSEESASLQSPCPRHPSSPNT